MRPPEPPAPGPPVLSFDQAGACLGKDRFANGTEAWRRVKTICTRRRKNRRKRHDAGGHVYRCPHCGGWHIGRSILKKDS